MNISESIYLMAPIWMQNIFCSLYGAKTKFARYDKKFNKYLFKYISNDTLTKKLQAQEHSLRHIVKQAYKSSFWRDRFTAFGLNPNADNIYDEISKLPIITKQEIKENIDKILVKPLPSDLLSAHTSGTTGSGLQFYYTRDADQKQWAIWWRYRLEHGLNFGNLQGWFGGRTVVPIQQNKPPYWRINIPGKQILFSQYHLNKNTAPYYFEKLKKSGVTWLHGYPSQISLFASLVGELALGPLPALKFVTVSSESLLAHQKRLIEAFLGVRVLQHYGLTEAVANISETRDGRFEVDHDFCYVEFVPLDYTDSNRFKIIGTNLVNEAFPLFRYDTGDIAYMEHNDKKGWEVLSIDGRQEDFLTLANGSKVGRLDHIFKDLASIREAQIIQDKAGVATFLIVKGAQYDKYDEETNLRHEIKNRLGDQIKFNIKYVKEIPRTKNGKLRLVKSTAQ